MFKSSYKIRHRRVPDSLASRMLNDRRTKLAVSKKRKRYTTLRRLQMHLGAKPKCIQSLPQQPPFKHSQTCNTTGSRSDNSNSLDILLSSVKAMAPSDQLNIWKNMIDNHSFNLNQLRALHATIEDRIKIDIISGVPYEIALYIMSFLSPKDLCQAAQTCRSWRIVCEDNRLWREKCKEEGLLSDEQTLDTLFRTRIANRNVKQERFVRETITSVPRSEWKDAYLKHIDIIRNWKTRKFEISEPFIASNVTHLNPPRVALEKVTSPIRTRNQVKQTARLAQLATSSPRELEAPSCLRGCSGAHHHKHRNYISSCSKEGSLSPSTTGRHHFPKIEDGYITKKHLMQLRCHEDSVITCLQYNPKTETIVSGSDDQTLKVWSSETGRCINTLEGHTGGVWSSQLSPDDIVISGATDRTVKVWKAHTGETLHTLYGHTSTVRCLALDGNYVVSGSRDSTLRLWDIEEGTCVHVFQGHTAAVRCVEYKNNIIVSGAYDYLVMVWDAITGNCYHALECHLSRIYSLQFDGRTIASGSLDSTICIWDAQTGKLRHHLEGHQSLTSKMQLKGNLLVSANADSFCKIWDINTGECMQTLGGDGSDNKHTSAITSVYFNNRYVVTSSDDGTVKLWDVGTGKFIRDLVVLPTASKGGVVWRIRASYDKLICAVGSRTQTEDTHLLVLDFNPS